MTLAMTLDAISHRDRFLVNLSIARQWTPICRQASYIDRGHFLNGRSVLVLACGGELSDETFLAAVVVFSLLGPSANPIVRPRNDLSKFERFARSFDGQQLPDINILG